MIDGIESIRGDIAELRHRMDARFMAVEAAIERILRDQTRMFYLAAFNLAATIGLYGVIIARWFSN